MSVDAQLLEEAAIELFEDAPCGYITTRLDGTIVQVNRTFERLTGLHRADLLDQRRFPDLLSVGARIYYETHLAPLLQMQGSVSEIAVEVRRADGTRLPALVNSVLHRDETGEPRAIRTTLFDATARRRYEQELVDARDRDRSTALRLQRSLLDGALPTSPAFELGVFYTSAGRGIEVGGDWYDAFWFGDGERLGLVMGDVVGRGLTAATTMGQLRSAVRALATLDLPPAALLTALDTYSRRYGVGAMTTVLYAELHPASRQLRLASAGHPPPLIAPDDAEPSFAWEGRSLPINALAAAPARQDGAVTLPASSTVLLYTDGLVEHRRRPADRGMRELAELVAGQPRLPLNSLIELIADRLFDPDTADDRSLMAVRLSGPA